MKRLVSQPIVLALAFFPLPTLAGASVDPSTLLWFTCQSCPEPPEVVAAGATVTVGIAGRPENGVQANSRHVAAALLPPAPGYRIKLRLSLFTWDSYNPPGTPNPPFNGGTGFWDSFLIAVSSKPYWQLALTDPLTTTQLPGLGFLWGGSSYGDLAGETFSADKEIYLPGNPAGDNYLNVGLDTATLPHSNHLFPSWGKFEILAIELACGTTSLSVPLYKQCDASWADVDLGYTKLKMCQWGCAVSSAAMVLSFYGVPATPKSLNDYLTQLYTDTNGNGKWDPGEPHYGYTPGGNIIWAAVGSFSGGKVQFKGFGPGSTTLGFDELDNELCANRPTILEVPGHFVVATGKTTSTYTINDPAYPRNTLAQYGGQFLSTRKFGPPGSGAFMVVSTPNVHLLVTDPLGRRVGYDPASGGTLAEIIGSSYVLETILSDDPSNPGIVSAMERTVFIPSPWEGVYDVRVIGLADGPAYVIIYRYNNQDLPQAQQAASTNLAPGAVVSLNLTYSTRPGDLNSDGVVNDVDLQIVRRSFGRRLGQPGFDPVADTNNDRIVDIRDLAYVARNAK
jgi:hypothetical protein